ncbi:hypothetical protein GWI33_016865 [Rhynchophorus ferrugineus]|uniref:Uncharacterized protein n=1 Tax=Rhynchophorus ferrugineus TaxID=354439 RepID=A0A834M2Z2_RHYFE|nr:hypothetical protein GWI33_016865 [Rhynchophorus ferrugineus]
MQENVTVVTWRLSEEESFTEKKQRPYSYQLVLWYRRCRERKLNTPQLNRRELESDTYRAGVLGSGRHEKGRKPKIIPPLFVFCCESY